MPGNITSHRKNNSIRFVVVYWVVHCLLLITFITIQYSLITNPQFEKDKYYLLIIILCFVTGISAKSQILFAIVFTTRYIDLFTVFISLYNSFMKVVFLSSTYGTLYLMFYTFKTTYDYKYDRIR